MDLKGGFVHTQGTGFDVPQGPVNALSIVESKGEFRQRTEGEASMEGFTPRELIQIARIFVRQKLLTLTVVNKGSVGEHYCLSPGAGSLEIDPVCSPGGEINKAFFDDVVAKLLIVWGTDLSPTLTPARLDNMVREMATYFSSTEQNCQRLIAQIIRSETAK